MQKTLILLEGLQRLSLSLRDDLRALSVNDPMFVEEKQAEDGTVQVGEGRDKIPNHVLVYLDNGFENARRTAEDVKNAENC